MELAFGIPAVGLLVVPPLVCTVLMVGGFFRTIFEGVRGTRHVSRLGTGRPA
jgi:hypothetical protein